MGYVSALYNVRLRSGRQSAIAPAMSTARTSTIRRNGRSITGCISPLHFQMHHSLSIILRIVAQTESYIQIMRCVIACRNVPNRCVMSRHNAPNRSRCGDRLRCAIPRRNFSGRCVISRHNVSNRARYGDSMRCAISGHNVSNGCVISSHEVPNRARCGDRLRCVITSHLVWRHTTGNLVIIDRWDIWVGWPFRRAL